MVNKDKIARAKEQIKEKRKEEFATAEDILSGSKRTKKVELKTLNNSMVEIRKLTVGDMSEINANTGDDVIEQFTWFVYKGMIKPVLELSQVKDMEYNTILEIGTAISRFSGLDRESASKTLNLLEISTSGQPS